MKALAGITIISAALLAGCGGDNAATIDQANQIAAFSQDADQHQEQFANAIKELAKEKSCQLDYMMSDEAGFWRVTGETYYFIHCGTLYSDNNVQTWYFDPTNQKLERVKAAM